MNEGEFSNLSPDIFDDDEAIRTQSSDEDIFGETKVVLYEFALDLIFFDKALLEFSFF